MRLPFVLLSLGATIFLSSCITSGKSAAPRKRSPEEIREMNRATTYLPKPKPKPKPVPPPSTELAPRSNQVKLKPFLPVEKERAEEQESGSETTVPEVEKEKVTEATPETPPVESMVTPTPVEKTSEPAAFAVPVPGKSGFVTSPYSPDSGFIDVTGLPPGTEAKDPYTGKIFRVP